MWVVLVVAGRLHVGMLMLVPQSCHVAWCRRQHSLTRSEWHCTSGRHISTHSLEEIFKTFHVYIMTAVLCKRLLSKVQNAGAVVMEEKQNGAECTPNA